MEGKDDVGGRREASSSPATGTGKSERLQGLTNGPPASFKDPEPLHNCSVKKPPVEVQGDVPVPSEPQPQYNCGVQQPPVEVQGEVPVPPEPEPQYNCSVKQPPVEVQGEVPVPPEPELDNGRPGGKGQ